MSTCQPPTAKLLLEIAHCPNVRRVQVEGDYTHPCAKIVLSQEVASPEQFQLPEPWNGDLEHAPILFLASNPSVSSDEAYPMGTWSDEQIQGFFSCRFGGDREVWVKDGMYARKKDGTYFKDWVRFWAAVRQRAVELLATDTHAVRPGQDYALAEVVRCKSRAEIGVHEAADECVGRYLERMLVLSGAKVIVCLGTHAAAHMRRIYTMPEDATLLGPITIGRQPRYIAFLPHPNHRGKRTFATCLDPEKLETLRRWLCE